MIEKPTITQLLSPDQAKQGYPLLRQTVGGVLAPGPWKHRPTVAPDYGDPSSPMRCSLCGKDFYLDDWSGCSVSYPFDGPLEVAETRLRLLINERELWNEVYAAIMRSVGKENVMRELKFKLKRHGRTVGYAKFAIWDHNLGTLQMVYCASGSDDWRLNPNCISQHGVGIFDSVHPFICRDRNGRDVYEGDKVTDRGKEYLVVRERMGFALRCIASDTKIEGVPYFRHEACVPEDIELIDESEATHEDHSQALHGPHGAGDSPRPKGPDAQT